jgi:ABC-type multidrug transport system ATPase subunit/ABC-type multidrug transport system permease subunit
MQVWDTRAPKKLENFYCTFSGCSFYTQIVNGQTNIFYQCSTTKCNCTFESSLCTATFEPSNPEAYFVYQTVMKMATTAVVQCISDAMTCTLTQNEMEQIWKMIIPVKCTAGECLTKYIPPPPPRPPAKNYLGLYAGVVFAASILVLLVLGFSCSIFSTFQTKQMSYLHRELQKCPVRGSTLTFKNLSYDLSVRQGLSFKKKRLLNNVSHHVESGQIMAIMGPSGAGKTTLLDILAHRKKRGTVTGSVLIDGKEIDTSFRRKSGYVFQDDILMGTLTVRECLTFAANLRLPDAVSKQEKRKRVQAILEELGIDHVADVKVGSEMARGISGGEKRRLSIACELVTNPHILFLDEPTSGLDSYNALSVIRCLNDLAKQGRTIIFSIHQPSSAIFDLFDQLVLVAKGKIAYAGPAKGAITHFESRGHVFRKNFNPADVLIDIITNLEKSKKGSSASSSPASPPTFSQGERENLVKSDSLRQNNMLDDEEYIEKEQKSTVQKIDGEYDEPSSSYRRAGRGADDDDEANEEEERGEANYKETLNEKRKSSNSNNIAVSANHYGSVTQQEDYEGTAASKSRTKRKQQQNNQQDYQPDYQLPANAEKLDKRIAYSTSFASQFLTLSGRAFKNFARNFFLMPSHYGSAVLLGGLLGWVFWQSPLDLEGIQNRLGAIFFMFGILSFGAMVSLEIFVSERALYVRERANGYFYPAAYFLSKCLFDIIPLRLIPPVIMGSIIYWMIGLRADWVHFGFFLLVMVLFNFSASSLCLAVGAVAPSVASGNFFCIILILFFMLFGGFMLNLKTLPVYLSWIKYTSIFFYGFEALAINDLYNVQILINPPETIVQPYIGTGSFVLELFGLKHERFYLDIVMMFVFSIGYITLAALLLKFFVKEKR